MVDKSRKLTRRLRPATPPSNSTWARGTGAPDRSHSRTCRAFARVDPGTLSTLSEPRQLSLNRQPKTPRQAESAESGARRRGRRGLAAAERGADEGQDESTGSVARSSLPQMLSPRRLKRPLFPLVIIPAHRRQKRPPRTAPCSRTRGFRSGLFDQIHAVEFDLKRCPAPKWEVII